MIDAQLRDPALTGEEAVGDHVAGGEASFAKGIISSSAGLLREDHRRARIHSFLKMANENSTLKVLAG